MPKLQSPIKSLRGAIKVVDAGADEVYCAVTIPELRKFSLYRGPRCAVSSYDELGKIANYAHDHGVDVIVAINEPFMGELVEKSVKKHISSCIEKEIDAIIVGDIGILGLVKDSSADLPLYASTYFATMNDASIELLRKIGFSRVILERQLTIQELYDLTQHSKVDVEIFLGGAGCSNINVDCYLFHAEFPAMNQAFLTIDGLKFPCAMPFEVYDVDDADKMLDKLPILDAYTFCSICLIPELMKIGVAGFKIEGRCLNDEYHEATTKLYRELIDIVATDKIMDFRERVKSLQKSFTPLPGNMPLPNLKELSCEQKRCHYSELFNAPYKYPMSWQAWTKHQFKYIEVSPEKTKE